MDAFGDDNFGSSAEVDPAAEFLAREQDQLAGLEDELEPIAAAAKPGTHLIYKQNQALSIFAQYLYIFLIYSLYEKSLWPKLAVAAWERFRFIFNFPSKELFTMQPMLHILLSCTLCYYNAKTLLTHQFVNYHSVPIHLFLLDGGDKCTPFCKRTQ
jgi:hypothetical protein